MARGYILEELDLAAVAAELHEPDVKRLRVKLENDELLKGLGLGVLLLLRENGKIKRAFWDSNADGNSVMQLTGSSLDYTTPRYGNLTKGSGVFLRSAGTIFEDSPRQFADLKKTPDPLGITCH